MQDRSDEPARALITGVGGQDGSYLSELLLAEGYRVYGTVKSRSAESLRHIAHLQGPMEVLELDLLDRSAIEESIQSVQPTEIYNFAARASSSTLQSEPAVTLECNGLAVVRMLEAILRMNRAIRFCQASSSEMFGATDRSPQDEETPFRPRNAYGAAKLYAHWMVANFRHVHGLFACSAILFNHESPRRGPEYVTRKISRGVAMIRAGHQEKLELGDLEAQRDWGFAGDYVRAMWRMLQVKEPSDYVIATGRSHSVREVCEIAFRRAGLDYRRHVIENAVHKRQAEAIQLVGDSSRARRLLGWEPATSFVQLVEMMVDADLAALQDDVHPAGT
jgi:GDPmannose 4,6-dehydratase